MANVTIPSVIPSYNINIKEVVMTKEVVKHRKDEKKKPALTAKEKKAKKQAKKAS